jgi:hypothetical protein
MREEGSESSVIEAAGRSRPWRALAVGAATLLLLAALVGTALAASTNFFEANSSPEATGIGPVSVVAADLDGDGDQDLATANVSGGNVTILLNKGSGNFVEKASSPEPAGSFPSSLTAADLDGDGDQDIAVTNQVSDDVTILRNNGSGNFSEPASSPVPAGDTPASVAAADLDGDGDQDLAVADHVPTNNVTILKNNGSGKFSQAASSPEDAGNSPSSLTAADLDGDGDQDLAVANQQSGNVTILRNNGSGNFGEPASSPVPAGTFPQGIAAADLNGDGDFDLAVANQGAPSNVTILRNNGSGAFSEPASSPEPVGGRPFAVVAADFDGDSDQDLATANHDGDNSTILANNGSGNFTEPPTSPEGAGDGPFALAAKDLDGDLDPDLAIANNSVSNLTILKNR